MSAHCRSSVYLFIVHKGARWELLYLNLTLVMSLGGGRTGRLCLDRWVVTHGSGFQQMPDLIGELKLLLPDHLRSWTDAARMCGWAADREGTRIVAAAAAPPPDVGRQGLPSGSRRTRPRRRPAAAPAPAAGAGVGAGPRPRPVNGGTRPPPQPKKHALPQSGLAGMLSFLGCPREPHVPNRTRRGMNVVESLAQCVVCLVRLGVPVPVTSRITQAWGPAGEYAGSSLEELAIEPPPSSVSAGGGAAAVLTGASVAGGAGRGAAAPLLVGGPVPLPMAMSRPVPGGSANNDNGAEKQGKKKNKKNRKENNNNNNNNGSSANEVYNPPQREGPPPLWGNHSQQQYAPGGPRRGDGRGGGGAGGGEQWHNGAAAPGGGWAGGAGSGGRGNPVPAWRRNLPVDSLAPDYLDYFVRERERMYYKSAGILPYR